MSGCARSGERMACYVHAALGWGRAGAITGDSHREQVRLGALLFFPG